jgi:hypothetical protein
MQYRIVDPTLAVVESAGEKRMITVPSGAIVVADESKLSLDQLIEVSCNGSSVFMFAQDIRVRGQAISCHAA